MGKTTAFQVGWQTKPLSELAVPITDEAGDGDYETLSISAGVGFVNQAEKFGKELSGSQYTHYTVIRRGDFAYNKGNSKRYPQGCVYMLKDRDVAVVPNVFISFRIEGQCSDYYEQLFISGYLNGQLFRKINFGVRNNGLLNLYDDDFYSCYMPLPPFTEQRAIAEILTTADRAIALRERLIAVKRQQKRWLMQELLRPKKGWKSVRLENYLVEVSNISNEVDIYPIYTSARTGLLPQQEYYSKKEIVRTKIGYKLVAPKQMTYRHMSDDEIFRININNTGFTILVSSEYPVFETKNLDSVFLIEYLNSQQSFRKFCKAQKKGGMRTRLYYDVLKTFRLPLPSLFEQRAIAKILTTADREIELLNRELEQQRQIKKYLMQQLLTGKKRVGGAAA